MGGVILLYLAWVQSTQLFFWSEVVVISHLERMVAYALAEGLRISQQEKVDMRTATYMLAVHRVAAAMALREIFRNYIDISNVVRQDIARTSTGSIMVREVGSYAK